jgi:hypothetical protein
MTRSATSSGAFERAEEPLAVDRLEDVIDCVDVDCAHGELIERRHENHCRHPLGADGGDHVEPVHLGHLHVEEYEIGLEVGDRLDRGSAVAAFGDDLDIVRASQLVADTAPSDRLVIDDERSNCHFGELVRRGMARVTITPPPSASDTRNRWSPP